MTKKSKRPVNRTSAIFLAATQMLDELETFDLDDDAALSASCFAFISVCLDMDEEATNEEICEFLVGMMELARPLRAEWHKSQGITQ